MDLEEQFSKEESSSTQVDPPNEDKSVTLSFKQETSDEKQKQTSRTSAIHIVLEIINKYWFLAGLAAAISIAYAAPEVGKTSGYIRSEYSIKYGAVCLIFFLSGVSLYTRILAKEILRFRVHLLVQVISFIIIPFFSYGIYCLFLAAKVQINHAILVGMVIATCTPTTISSNTVMTKKAKGNEYTALMNASLGNILGVFISPILVTLFVGTSASKGSEDYGNILGQLGLQVLLPLGVGQLVLFFFPKTVDSLKVKLKFNVLNSIALLLLVWSIFCDTWSSHALDNLRAIDFVFTILLDATFYVLFTFFCYFLARLPIPFMKSTPRWIRWWRLSREDTVAICYCGATKTVAMGVILINILYGAESAGQVGVLSAPLLMYHVLQLIIGTILVNIFKRWVEHGLEEETAKLANSTADAQTDKIC